MKLSDMPARFPLPFGASAGVGYIRNVPTNPTGTPGQASLQTGFPPENFNPVNAGGIPPFGQDMNGILNRATAWNRWAATGSFPPYDPTWQADVGGYPKGSCVASLIQFGCVWISLVDDNVTNPDAGGAGWYRFIQIISANTDLYVNASTGNDSNDGLTPATAMASIQAAVYRAFGFPPSQYTITIHVADGTYGAVATPTYSGPNIVVDGNVSNPANVLISSGTNSAFSVTGPNTVTVKNLKIQTGTGGTPANGFEAVSGATLTTENTVSGFVEGAVFAAVQGTIRPGPHAFTGNADSMFYSNVGGVTLMSSSITYTVPVAISVNTGVAFANNNGSIRVSIPQPTFSVTGSVTGRRYFARLNGVVDTQGAGASYFPGSIAGSTVSGGQYA